MLRKKPESVVTIPPFHLPLPHWHPGSRTDPIICLVDDRGKSTCAFGHYDSTSPTGLLQGDLWRNPWPTQFCRVKSAISRHPRLISCTPISVARSFTTPKQMFISPTLQCAIHSSSYRTLERFITVFHPSPDRCTQLTCATSSSPCSVSCTHSTLKSATTSSGACLGGRGSE